MTSDQQLPGIVVDEVANRVDDWPLVESKIGFRNNYLTVTLDRLRSPAGDEHERVVVRPRGAVAVVALDDSGRVLLVQQFRHAIGQRSVEIPAGILDIAGESKIDAAARELAEEADIVAAKWEHLLQINPTPGFCSEQIDIFLATELSAVPVDERTAREAEEADMEQWWIDLDLAIAAALEGKITDAKTIAGLLAASRR